jgi:putative transposase
MSAAPKLYLVPSAEFAEWISADEAIRRTGLTDRWLREQARAGIIISRLTGRTARNGKPLREYLLSSLPVSATSTTSSALAPRLPLFAETDAALPPPAAPDTLPVGAAAQRQAEERYAVLQPVLDFEKDPLRYASLRLKSGSPVTSQTRMLEYQAELKGISSRSLKIWMKRWREGGLAALADAPYRNKGVSIWFELHPAAKDIAAAAYLQPEQSKAAAYEALERWCRQQQIAPPSYNTVRKWLDSEDLPRPVTVLAREGERALNERHLPFLRRKYTDVPANHIWVSDHMIHDVLVRNDCFEAAAPNAAIRLRFTAIIDFRSRYSVGRCWTVEGSSRSIALALRRGIQRFGAPKIFYVDNGKDYKRVARGASPVFTRVPNQQFSADVAWIESLGVLSRLGIQVQHCLKYHPQSKHIERDFRTLHMRLDRIVEGYTTGNMYKRPDATNLLAAAHQKALKSGNPSASPLMKASEFIQIAETWLEQEHALTPHRGRGMDGRSPLEVYTEGYPESERVIPDLSALDHLFWARVQRKLDATNVRLNNEFYGPSIDDREGQQRLYLAGDAQVYVHYDENEISPASAIVTDLNGRMLARVFRVELQPQSAAAQPMISATMAERLRLKKATRETIKTIRQRADAAGYASALDVLRERAQLPAATQEMINDRPQRKAKPDSTAVAPPSAVEISSDFLEAIYGK